MGDFTTVRPLIIISLRLVQCKKYHLFLVNYYPTTIINKELKLCFNKNTLHYITLHYCEAELVLNCINFMCN